MIQPLLEDLAECLCAQIHEDGSPELCFCGIMPGDGFVAEYAGDCNDRCGAAYVRLTQAYPSVTAGQPDVTRNNCGASLGIDIEIGIIRCAPMPNSRGEAPPPAEVLAAARQQSKDILTMRKAVLCCNELKAHDYIMGTYTPVGPQGDALGGFWTLAVTF